MLRQAVSGNVRSVKNHYAPLLWLALLVPVAVGSAQRATSPPAPAAAGVTAKVVTAADAFLKTLNESERAKVTFGFASPQRTGWSNLPSGIFQRNGARLGDLDTAAARSGDGAGRVCTELGGLQESPRHHEWRRGPEEQRWWTHGRPAGRCGNASCRGTSRGPASRRSASGRGRGSVQFGQDEYYIALLGTPSATTPWIIQFGGHHLAINVTVVGANSVLTPSLPAAQPAKYTLNGQTIRPLGNENDKGFALINALTAEQQKQAILNYKVSDLVLGSGE